MDTTTSNKVSVLKDMHALGVAVAEGYAQQAEGILPESLFGTMKTLSERLAEGMSNEFHRLRDCQTQANDASYQEHMDECTRIHDKYVEYIPGYKEEFAKIRGVR